MQVYKTKAKKFTGSDFHEVHERAFGLYSEIKKKSKRRTKNPNNSKEMLYRFYGTDANNEIFCVQIKENLKKKQKFLISVFPVDGPIFY